MRPKPTPQLKLDERNHVEKPLLDQLHGLGWEIIDLTDEKQTPAHTFRENFTEVVLLPVLRKQLKVINDWLEDDQIDDVVKQLTASFPSTGLIENNQYVLRKKQMPFFRSFKRKIYGEKALDENEISVLVDLTQQVFLRVERELKLTGFWESIAARNKLKADIQATLIQPAYINLPNLMSNRAQIMSRIMEIAEKNNDVILYAG